MDERLRVAMFTNVYLPNSNGVVVSVEAFRTALTQLGHDVSIFGPDSGPIENRPPYVFRYASLELPMQKYPLALPVSPYIDRVLRNLQPHLLHAHHPALLGHVAERKSEELNLPLVFTYHTRYAEYSHYAKPLPEESVKDFILHWLSSFMSKCHHIVAPSQSIKNLLENNYGIEDHVSVVPTGIDAKRFSKYSREQARHELGWDPHETILISVGRLAKEKNFDLLLEAFALLKQENLRLVIVGGGDERANLEKLAEGLKVTFTGPQDVPIHLAASNLFVFASVTETQGLVTLEAMASGLPVVAVYASGTRDAVSPECALLTQATPEALARGIEEMLSRTDLHREAEAARLQASHFSLLNQGKAMLEVYRQAQAAHRDQQRVMVPSSESQSRWQEFLNLFPL